MFRWLGPLERANISIENHGTAKPTTPQSKQVQHLLLPASSLFISFICGCLQNLLEKSTMQGENRKYQILRSSKRLTFYNVLRHATSMLPFRRLACCAQRAAAMLIPSNAIAAGMIPDDRWMRTPNIPTSNQLKGKDHSLCQTQAAQKSEEQTANSTST